MAVPALKEQLASVVGVPAENQRLICRGKVLKDDQLLSAYSILVDQNSVVNASRVPGGLGWWECAGGWLLPESV